MKLAIAFCLVAVAAANRETECPPHSTLSNPPYHDMRSCTCNEGYEAYAFPGWGCYHKTNHFSCPAHSTRRDQYKIPMEFSDCVCNNGFAPYDNAETGKTECDYAYVFHVHGRVWINKPEDKAAYSKTEFDLNAENAFRKAMADAINDSETDDYQTRDCPGITAGQSACEAAGCSWTDTPDEETEGYHTDNSEANPSSQQNEKHANRRNQAATCLRADNTGIKGAKAVQQNDVMPYSIHNIEDIADDIQHHTLDHSHIVLAESDSTQRGVVRKESGEYANTGVAIGFAIRLRGTDITYGNQLINAMKKPSLAEKLKTNLAADSDDSTFDDISGAHVYVWALTGEFWRQSHTTVAPYTWAPKQADLTTTAPSPKKYLSIEMGLLGYTRHMFNDDAKSSMRKAIALALNNLDADATTADLVQLRNFIFGGADVADATSRRLAEDAGASFLAVVAIEQTSSIEADAIDTAALVSFITSKFSELVFPNPPANFAVKVHAITASAGEPTREPKSLPANLKATLNLGVTISCDCHGVTVANLNSDNAHLQCLKQNGYISMYDFPAHMQRFEDAASEALMTNSDKVVVADVSPAGLHPHNEDTWSPVHADPYANGIEVHFKVGSADWTNDAGNGIEDMKTTFNSAGFLADFVQKLQVGGWNVPKGCVMYNTDKSGSRQKGEYETHEWKTATYSPTPAPTPAPESTPGRTPNCVNGTVVAVRGHAEIISPAPVGDDITEHDTNDGLDAENTFMLRVRRCIASKLNADLDAKSLPEFQEATFRRLKGCDILVDEGEFKHEKHQIYNREEGTNSVAETGNLNDAGTNPGRRLIGKYDAKNDAWDPSTGTYDDPSERHYDPNRPLTDRLRHDGMVHVYQFKFGVYSPSTDMHRANAYADAIANSGSEFIKEVNTCMMAGAVAPAAYEDGSRYRPSVPTFSTLAMDKMELTYVAPQFVAPTPAPIVDQPCEQVWSQPSACTEQCTAEGKIGVQKIYGIITKPQVGNGQACEPLVQYSCPAKPNGRCVTRAEAETENPCNQHACPVDCKTTAWDPEWSTCTEECGGGTQERHRTVIPTGSPTAFDEDGQLTDHYKNDAAYMAAGGFKTCGDLTQTRECNKKPCPQDCQESEWGEWGQCTKQCKGPDEEAGKMWRRRTIVQQAYYGGADCGKLVESTTCNDNPCPTNCVVSQWSEWGTCSKSCAGQEPGARLFGARQERTRYVVKEAANGGHPCPSLVQSKLCALHPCGAHVCTVKDGFPLTCTYENNIVYTHHVNDVHDKELFMCYHNYVTEVCTCLCWKKAHLESQGTLKYGVHRSYYKQGEEPKDVDGNVNGAAVQYKSGSFMGTAIPEAPTSDINALATTDSGKVQV